MIVLQAMDAAGKDGTIKHVFARLNPAAVHVHSFKQPSTEEKEHDYMWRVNKALPSRGEIGIFNRSHYEDVVIARIHNLIESDGLPEELISDGIWKKRYRQICDWEKYLTENGFPVIKIFLHVSKAEQKKAPHRPHRDQAEELESFSMPISKNGSTGTAIRRCTAKVISATTKNYAPWYVVPADNKWYTRYVVAQIVLKSLREINPDFPKLSAEVESQLEQFRKILKNIDIEDLKSIKESMK